MRRTNAVRILVVVAGLAGSVFAAGVKPVHAATQEMTATINVVADQQQGSPLQCSVGPGAAATWTCSTRYPIFATGLQCVQTADVVIEGQTIPLAKAGCQASLSIPSWGFAGPAVCANSTQAGRQCNAATDGGTAAFSFQPVAGTSINDPNATITDASCSPSGGHINVKAQGVVGTTTFAMTSTVAWTGSCFDAGNLTWQGTVTEVD
jgi:hypothetical protein